MSDDLTNPAVKPVPSGHRWILFVSGPTASGKTSVAKYLADELDLKFVEGDAFPDAASPVVGASRSFQESRTRWLSGENWNVLSRAFTVGD